MPFINFYCTLSIDLLFIQKTKNLKKNILRETSSREAKQKKNTRKHSFLSTKYLNTVLKNLHNHFIVSLKIKNDKELYPHNSNFN